MDMDSFAQFHEICDCLVTRESTLLHLSESTMQHYILSKQVSSLTLTHRAANYLVVASKTVRVRLMQL